MLAWIVLQVPLALFPAPALPTCQLEVLAPSVIEERVLRDFDHRVSAYVRLHRRLERSLPPQRLFGDLEDMPFAVDALHAVIVDARPNVQAGTIFTPAVADVLTARLERAIFSKGYTPAEAVIAMNLGHRDETTEPQVNGRFPALRHWRVWPELLAALPDLPEELQYRFFGRDLVLVDVHADLVVDILKDALPSPYAELVSDFAPPRTDPQPPRRDA